MGVAVAKITGKTLVLAVKLIKESNYSAGLLAKLGLDTSYTSGANDLYISASVEKLIEDFGWIGFKCLLEPSGTPPKSRLTHIMACPPDKNPQDVIGEQYDGKKILNIKMASFEEHI
ncbi:hypothetical protein [Spirulina sp. 06S082]|uniref:hypothetical protein n=1 Tax=Spirulina sp. 06S082 TaxID=3110248 RepID=UPI002B217372|nr:hypothetical protein [Spirulina sp. 06S082]MEA5469332.1 hypothetical protein [Spirulina sp. 06S082]